MSALTLVPSQLCPVINQAPSWVVTQPAEACGHGAGLVPAGLCICLCRSLIVCLSMYTHTHQQVDAAEHQYDPVASQVAVCQVSAHQGGEVHCGLPHLKLVVCTHTAGRGFELKVACMNMFVCYQVSWCRVHTKHKQQTRAAHHAAHAHLLECLLRIGRTECRITATANTMTAEYAI